MFVAGGGGGSLPDTTNAAAGPRGAGPPGWPELGVCVVATFAAVVITAVVLTSDAVVTATAVSSL